VFEAKLRFIPLFLVYQESWSKDFASVANVIVTVGEPALRCLGVMEAQGVHLTAGLLRSSFEGMVVPSDQAEVFRRLESLKRTKITAALLKETAAAVKEDRMWTWILMHSQLTEQQVHPTRSMLPSNVVVPWLVSL
jgi:hypothetical protein